MNQNQDFNHVDDNDNMNQNHDNDHNPHHAEDTLRWFLSSTCCRDDDDDVVDFSSRATCGSSSSRCDADDIVDDENENPYSDHLRTANNTTTTTNNNKTNTRVTCDTCHAKNCRWYCCDCCRLLIPRPKWPSAIREGRLTLPFSVDIILHDRRASATGVQVHTILMAAAAAARADRTETEDHTNTPPQPRSSNNNNNNRTCSRLFDIDRKEEIPDYRLDNDGTYLLFPGPHSRPWSSVGSHPIRRLVVLDCKWTQSYSLRSHPHLVDLPQVHLDFVNENDDNDNHIDATKNDDRDKDDAVPKSSSLSFSTSSSPSLPKPTQSYYWRWHNAGENMLSTIEAIYYAAWSVATSSHYDTTTTTQQQQQQQQQQQRQHDLVYLFWLFGIIRQVIQSRYDEGRVRSFIHPPAVPFLESSKEFYRLLRKQKGKSITGAASSSNNSDGGSGSTKNDAIHV